MGTTAVRKVLTGAALTAVLVLLVPTSAMADGPQHGGSVVVRANADVTVPAGAERDAVVVLGGNAAIQGHVRTLVVVNGSATLTGARVGVLAVLNGTIEIGPGSTVASVWAAGTTYHAAGNAEVASLATVDLFWIAAGLVASVVSAGIIALVGLAIVASMVSNDRAVSPHDDPDSNAAAEIAGNAGRPISSPSWR